MTLYGRVSTEVDVAYSQGAEELVTAIPQSEPPRRLLEVR